MLMSFKEGEALLKLRNTAKLEGYFSQRQAHVPQDAPALSMDEINQIVHELRP